MKRILTLALLMVVAGAAWARPPRPPVGGAITSTQLPANAAKTDTTQTFVSSVTFQNAGFSVGGSTLVVTGGMVGIGSTAPSATLDVVGTEVRVSSATTSTDSICLAGAYATLPTSGYARGCLAVQTSNMKLYISTETVTGAGSWAATH